MIASKGLQDALIYKEPLASPMRLSWWQSDVFQDKSRFRVEVCGRRAGKTTEMKVELAQAAINQSNQNVGYWAPTWTMAKELMWEQLKAFIPRAYWYGKPSESDLILRLRNGSKIYLKSGEVPDRSRGPGWDFVALDEFAYMDKFDDLWNLVLFPALADRMGRALFATTPKGLNHAYDLYQDGQNPDEPDWKSFRVTTLEGGRVSAKEIERARRKLDARKFKQEWEASFEALGGRVIYAYDDRVHKNANVKDLGGDLYIGMDFNVNPMTAVLASNAGGQLHVFDEIVLTDSNTTEMCNEIARRYPDRRIFLCPDPSGRARKTAATGGMTDFSIIENAGFTLDTAPGPIPLADRLSATNAIFRTADGSVNAYIHPRCTRVIRSLLGHIYKDGTTIPAKDGMDHAVAALGYMVWQQFNLFGVGNWSEFRAIW